MSYISTEHDPQDGEPAPTMDTVSVKSTEPYIKAEPLYSLGALFASKKKRIKQICPICGEPYAGLPTALACPKHAKQARNKRYRDKQKLKLKL